MSLREDALYALARFRQKLRPLRPRGDSWESYLRWQFESSDKIFSRYPNFDVRGKTVLDIGCGTGGRSAYLATLGAKRVLGIDINAEEIGVAQRLCPEIYPQTAGHLEFAVSREGHAPELGVFDIVLLVDCMEHMVSPPQILKMAYDYTAPGGRCYFSTFGWYHHEASHSGLLPFVQLFFSDENILNVTRRLVRAPDYQPARFDSDPPEARWEGIYDLRHRPGEYLNKITVAEMKKLIKYSKFARGTLTLYGFSHPIFKLVNPLRHVPVLQEVFHSYLVAELVK